MSLIAGGAASDCTSASSQEKLVWSPYFARAADSYKTYVTFVNS